MRDCNNAEMRDRLPELMHGRLHGEMIAATLSHVTECAECRAELALLERIRAGAPSPVVDASRIVAALPRYRSVPWWLNAIRSLQLRAAAAIVLLIGGYALVARTTVVEPTDSVRVVGATAAASQELAIGSFHDLSDTDLAAMLDELGALEAVTPDVSEEVVVPVLTRPAGGGGSS